MVWQLITETSWHTHQLCNGNHQQDICTLKFLNVLPQNPCFLVSTNPELLSLDLYLIPVKSLYCKLQILKFWPCLPSWRFCQGRYCSPLPRWTVKSRCLTNRQPTFQSPKPFSQFLSIGPSQPGLTPKQFLPLADFPTWHSTFCLYSLGYNSHSTSWHNIYLEW